MTLLLLLALLGVDAAAATATQASSFQEAPPGLHCDPQYKPIEHCPDGSDCPTSGTCPGGRPIKPPPTPPRPHHPQYKITENWNAVPHCDEFCHHYDPPNWCLDCIPGWKGRYLEPKLPMPTSQAGCAASCTAGVIMPGCTQWSVLLPGEAGHSRVPHRQRLDAPQGLSKVPLCVPPVVHKTAYILPCTRSPYAY
jgi:hypothetical protein